MVQPALDSSKIAVLPPNAPSNPTPARPKLSGPGRRTPPRLRVFFLRHFRACGEVKLAAERTGVAVSTLYRWRDRDNSFRERWDELADQRRQMVEDRLMSFVLEGEKTAVFHKGEQVGWRYSHTARAAIAALAYFDRREKALQAEAARKEARHKDADQEDDDDELSPEVQAWVERSERAREERLAERALASRSEAAPEPKEVVKSDTSPAPAPRKIGNGPALPAFDRDRVPNSPPSPPPSPPPRPPQPRVVAAPVPAPRPLHHGRPLDDPATSRRITRELLRESSSSHLLVDNWKPYGH